MAVIAAHKLTDGLGALTDELPNLMVSAGSTFGTAGILALNVAIFVAIVLVALVVLWRVLGSLFGK